VLRSLAIRVVRVAGLAAFCCPLLLSRQSAPLAFEVASIRLAAPNARGDSIRTLPGGGLNASNVTLRTLIGFVYRVRDSETFGGPIWTGSERYNVIAKPGNHEETAGVGLQESVRQRLQALLADRFHLSVHRETRELPVFALIAAKGGPKLKPSTAGGAALQALASTLTEILGRPVRDKTGLSGTFDFTIRWAPEQP
jgi:hypothetical protein